MPLWGNSNRNDETKRTGKFKHLRRQINGLRGDHNEEDYGDMTEEDEEAEVRFDELLSGKAVGDAMHALLFDSCGYCNKKLRGSYTVGEHGHYCSSRHMEKAGDTHPSV